MRKKEKGEIPMEMPGYMLVSWCRSLGASIRFPCIRIHNMHPASIGSEIREFHALENAEAKFRNECEEKWTSEPKTSALLDCPGVHCDIEGRPRIIWTEIIVSLSSFSAGLTTAGFRGMKRSSCPISLRTQRSDEFSDFLNVMEAELAEHACDGFGIRIAGFNEFSLIKSQKPQITLNFITVNLIKSHQSISSNVALAIDDWFP